MYKGKVDCVIGLCSGDEGKGKIVDFLAENYEIIARFAGGDNAGHTIFRNGKKVVLHILPSGIFHDHTLNIIGNGVVINPINLKREIETIEELGIDVKKKLVISDKAHIITPYHRFRDAKDENELGENKIGSTLKGIAPCYGDKALRRGIRVLDLLKEDFKSNFKNIDNHDLTEFFEACDYLKNLNVQKTEILLNSLLDSGKSVLAEGAQAFGLDIDFGTYPYVTSSITTTAGVCQGLGISPKRIGTVWGVFKAYNTRVGNGPFETEIFDEIGDQICKRGNEFGSTTGRKRRCGWLNLDEITYASTILGVDNLVLTKSDVLSNLGEIKYYIDGQYKSHEGWGDFDKTNPDPNFLNFVETLETHLNLPITIVSLGVLRDDIVKNITKRFPVKENSTSLN